MAFWDNWKAKRDLAPGEGEGKLRAGKKHGRWRERAEKATTRWTGKEFVPVDHDLTELVYVDGVKHGPFTVWWGNGGKRSQGTYVDGERDGLYESWNREGTLIASGTMRAGKPHGRFRQNHFDTGRLAYEGEYVDGKRHGPWKSGHENGQLHEQGAHADGDRDGAWTISSEHGVVRERGSYRRGKREGAWTFFGAHGTLAEGNYVDDKRAGAWTLHRDDGSLRAQGEYREGQPTGMWRFYSPSGAERTPRECVDEQDVARWDELETCIELLAGYEASDAWIASVKAAFTALQRPWEVEATRDPLGQTFLSAPLDAHWQMRVALGVPLHIVCRDECWSRILTLVENLPVERAAAAVEAVARVGCYTGFAPRDWLTGILEDEDDDPRTRIVSRFEPGRRFTLPMMERFRRRVPHLEKLSLRECDFPEGIAPLFETGFPELRQLLVLRSDLARGALAALVDQLAHATWPTRLERLAIVESGVGITDELLAALLANEHLRALKYLTLDCVHLGPRTASVLARRPALEDIDLRDSKLDLEALVALAAIPGLEELQLKRCELPAMTSREAARVGPSPKLRRLVLQNTLGIERYGDARSSYGVARCLAVMPALASVEVLDLSGNELDGLAARVLARSEYLHNLRELDWTGNEDDELDTLRALPGVQIATSTGRGNVFVMQL